MRTPFRRIALGLAALLGLVTLQIPDQTESTDATWRSPEYANGKVIAATLDYERPGVTAKFVPTGSRTAEMTLTYHLNAPADAYFDQTEVEYAWGYAHKALPTGASAWTKSATDNSLTTKFSLDLQPGESVSGVVLALRFVKPGGWTSAWLNVKGDYSFIILGHAYGVTTKITFDPAT